VQKWLFIFRECILRSNYYLLLLFTSVLFDLPIEIACGPFPLFPTKEQHPQGLSEIRDRYRGDSYRERARKEQHPQGLSEIRDRYRGNSYRDRARKEQQPQGLSEIRDI
jgi:hypothetical protein